MFKLFGKKVIVDTKPPVPEYIVFNVNNFNSWFNDKDNGAVYSNSGIFLRVDKLSESQILDYMEKCYGIRGGSFMWSKPAGIMVSEFYNHIRNDWMSKLRDY